MNSKLPATLNYIRNLRALLREVFQSPRAAEVPIRIHAPFPLPLSDESKAFMDDLEQVRRRYSVEAKDVSDDLKITKNFPRGRSASGSWHCHEKGESSRTTSPTMYQLAFVCETHARVIQGHLIVWIMYVLTLSLVHNGVDLEAPFK
ncbi:hypothetical protein PF011_g14084 [Phytophthora fragariae]|nr:hypothetical protein PF011_g14084 [Phytophthora fragariae]